jgi:hypothetical protein
MSALHPFPRLGKCLSQKYKLGKLELRPFGMKADDLGFDFHFSSMPLPVLVTNIIRSCTVSRDGKLPPESFFWSLQVGMRIECLLRIAASDNSPQIITLLRCLEKGCNERFELSLSLNDIFSKSDQVNIEDYCTINVSDRNIKLRRPTGLDQIGWLNLNCTDHNEMLKHIIMTLISEDGKVLNENELSFSLTPEVTELVDTAMSVLDPLIDYRIDLKCPFCKTKHLYPINLEELSLKRLNDIQKELLTSIHRLASGYHWTENEILTIPPTRRRLYLHMLEAS